MYACEWNPHAVEALRRNLQLNSVIGRCIVLEGDNKITAPKVHLHWFLQTTNYNNHFLILFFLMLLVFGHKI